MIMSFRPLMMKVWKKYAEKEERMAWHGMVCIAEVNKILGIKFQEIPLIWLKYGDDQSNTSISATVEKIH